MRPPSIADARRALAAVPDGAIAQIGSFRDAMSARIERYSPMLDTYLDFSERLPAIFGWNEPRRYLVLTQDPAELRPTGGFIGSYGIIVFDRGSMTDHRFEDVVPLDYPWDYPRIEPPQQLADYLLGAQQPWQFADANWSPDFPTSARDALQLYTNESGDAEIDGVIGITTYTIDEILKVTGPVEVPDYDVTIAPGETTLKALQLTRAAAPGEDRKAFLPAFADSLIAARVLAATAVMGRAAGCCRCPARWPPPARLVPRSGRSSPCRSRPESTAPCARTVATTSFRWTPTCLRRAS